MKKVVIFPYHPDIETILLQKDELKGVCLYGICSFQEDESIVEKINKALGNGADKKELLKQCDVVLLGDNYRNYRNQKYYEIIELSIKNKKELWMMPQIAQQLDLKKYVGQYHILENILAYDALDKEEQMEVYYNRKYMIDTPIIAVAGMGKNSGKFECQLFMKTFLEKEGYKISWISSNDLGCLFDGYSMPNVLYNRAYTFEEKIIRFNHYVYKLAKKEMPDAIIIGIPEGIAEFEIKEYNHFGEYPLVIGKAVNIDSAILCMYYVDAIRETAKKSICNFTNTRYFIPVNTICIGRNTYVADESKNELSYAYLDEEYLTRHYAHEDTGDIPAHCLWIDAEKEATVQHIIMHLQSNADAL